MRLLVLILATVAALDYLAPNTFADVGNWVTNVTGGSGGILSMATGGIQQLAQAIAQAEGFGVPNAIPTRANNPGDLALGDVGNGTLGQGITIFASVEDGWNALYNQLSLIASGGSSYYSPGMSLAQFGATWANGDPNWARNVAAALGVSPDSPLGQFLS